MKPVLTWLLLLVIPVLVSAQTNWSPDQLLKIKNISAAEVSPDGKRVAYTIREAVMTDDRSEYVNQIWISAIDGSNAFQLTRGDKSNNNPKWSPDNQSIAFTSSRDGKSNLYIISLAGGEAEKITEVKGSVGDFSWSYDGKMIAYLTADVASDEEEKRKKAKDDWYFMEEVLKQNRLAVVWLNQKDSTGRLVQKVLTKDNINVNAFDWNKDGSAIVYSYGKSVKVNDNIYSDIAMVNIASGEIKTIANTPAGETNPRFSPDGQYISYHCTQNPHDWAGARHAQVYGLADGKSWKLKATPNEDGAILGWTKDGKALIWSEENRTRASIYLLGLDGQTISEWSKGEKDHISLARLNNSRTHLSFLLQNSSKFPELYVSTLDDYKPAKVTSINAGHANKPLGRTELIKWKGADGLEIEGLLTYPVNYQAGQKVPLILNIHGGPAGVFAETCIAANSGTYPLASFSEQGIAILRPNPRGSTGYGTAFRQANRADWGGKDYIDLMNGIDAVIKMGVADKDKLGVMGWSYGGFMSSWVVGHTNRFKVASIGAPVVDLRHQNLTDDVAGLLITYFNGDPWTNWDLYDKYSPLLYVQHVQTPVLLQHGEADQRVPVSNSIMFYNALKRRNIPVRLLVLPRQPHGPVEPRMVKKTMQTNLEWMGAKLK
ncbi:S9 family peptidase [Flavihumibacter rivuli]|uniref:S9 family peptidase n=1 Tax=Flavihumibacter rivuli TaxID=2838156 RepID=UPI001BDED0EB|nr:S9 family peptidase [Flavihumibacter rivuli]ULQ55653.1 S9 family peptidase [Flavihumibacter rivuli]